MLKLIQLAARNLLRYQRRTLLTSLLIVIGVAAVLLFMAISGSFKQLMIGQITDSMLGHLQVHRRGYVASIESLPLNMNMPPQLVARVQKSLAEEPAIAAVSQRIKFGAMFSNFTETTSLRVNGIDPDAEAAVLPLLAGRQLDGVRDGPLVVRGEVLIPVLVSRGLKVKPGDTIVLVATNRDGSVNGKTFKVRGTLESATGPGGRDGYIHIDDARELLRMADAEVSEIAVRLKDPQRIQQAGAKLQSALEGVKNKQGQTALELHTWERLSPFANIAKMIDVLTLAIKIMLVSIVLVSVMNVMIMAVYERIREIGAIAAIGTPPSRILGMFLTEGLMLGIAGTFIGVALSLAAIYALNIWQISYNFGQQKGLLLAPSLGVADIVTTSVIVIPARRAAGNSRRRQRNTQESGS
ncbi:MAG: ABC-type transport system, involved in lipoprotein release, permease component [Proteobacteria bacterium]|nr:ABC-type transport system, involved in lipoprotein release, permease component [Pseudomonadota bacterium]